MAEVATPSAAKIDNMDPGSSSQKDSKSAPPVKPERPDEEQYKSDLNKADKELKASEERMVRSQRTRDSRRIEDRGPWRA